MLYDRNTLKLCAKESLRGIQPRPWKVTLLFVLLAALIPNTVLWLLPDVNRDATLAMLYDIFTDPYRFQAMTAGMEGYEILGYYRAMCTPAIGIFTVTLVLTVLFYVFQMIMSYGGVYYGLKLYRREQTAFSDLFFGFSMAGKVIATALLTVIFASLWMLLALVLASCAVSMLWVTMIAFEGSELVTTLCVLILFAMAVVFCGFALFIGYRYSLAPYFVMTTDMGAMEAIRASKETMRGNFGRRLALALSFLGWELLNLLIALVVICIGTLVSLSATGISMALSGIPVEYLESATVMEPVVVGFMISVVLGSLAMVPLNLWLIPYESSAQAGFFLTVTTQEETPAPQKPVYTYTPPQPPQSGGIWDSVPKPPAFTAPEPPAAPAPTSEQEGAQPPAAPETPVQEPTSETPAPETPGEPSDEPAKEASAQLPAEPPTPEEEQS